VPESPAYNPDSNPIPNPNFSDPKTKPKPKPTDYTDPTILTL